MTRSVRQIIIENLRFAKPRRATGHPPGKEFHWKVEAGCIWAVTGGSQAGRTQLMRVLAGLEPPAGGKILVSHQDGGPPQGLSESGTAVAYLPPPGDEAFTGTTVEEELLFYSAGKDTLAERLDWIKENFGFDFRTCPGRSVWELSESQRRCLLLSSQAVALPAVWVCDQPLAVLDSRRSSAAADLFRNEAKRGAAVILALKEAEQVLDLAHNVLIIGERREVIYQGRTSSVPPEVAIELEWNPGLHKAAQMAGKGFDIKSLPDIPG